MMNTFIRLYNTDECLFYISLCMGNNINRCVSIKNNEKNHVYSKFTVPPITNIPYKIKSITLTPTPITTESETIYY